MAEQEARRILYEMSSPEERKELDELELDRIGVKQEKIEENLSELQKTLNSLKELVSSGAKTEDMAKMVGLLAQGIKSVKTDYTRQSQSSVEALQAMQNEFLKALRELRGTVEVGYRKSDINANAGPLYKTMINHLSGMETAFKNWKYPQYAAVSVRNKNFANINPAISPFAIEDYDDIVLAYTGSNLTTVTYKLNGVTKVVLTLSYDGSNNLIEAKRTS